MKHLITTIIAVLFLCAAVGCQTAPTPSMPPPTASAYTGIGGIQAALNDAQSDAAAVKPHADAAGGVLVDQINATLQNAMKLAQQVSQAVAAQQAASYAKAKADAAALAKANAASAKAQADGHSWLLIVLESFIPLGILLAVAGFVVYEYAHLTISEYVALGGAALAIAGLVASIVVSVAFAVTPLITLIVGIALGTGLLAVVGIAIFEIIINWKALEAKIENVLHGTPIPAKSVAARAIANVTASLPTASAPAAK